MSWTSQMLGKREFLVLRNHNKLKLLQIITQIAHQKINRLTKYDILFIFSYENHD